MGDIFTQLGLRFCNRGLALPQVQRKVVKAPIGEYIYFYLLTHISSCIYNCNTGMMMTLRPP